MALFSRERLEKLLEILLEDISRKLVAIKEGRKFSRQGLGKPTRLNQYLNKKAITADFSISHRTKNLK